MKFIRQLKLGFGKIRRFYMHMFNRDYVRTHTVMRSGACNRCGECCKLLFKCKYLVTNDEGHTECTRHNTRPGNCIIFPVDERDIRDRDIAAGTKGCGFYFDGKPKGWL